jgi:predicted O-methyltransferase YrrM
VDLGRDELLRELEETDRRERMEDLPREQRGRNITRDVGRFLRLLIRVTGARRILEIGGSIGYSTLWLGLAAEANGGTVLSLEHVAWRAEQARENLSRAGLDNVVTVEVVDATTYLDAADPGQAFDFVFLDAEKEDYARHLTGVYPLVRAGGLIVADNTISHAADVADFLAAIASHPHLESVVVPIGRGEAISLKVESRISPEDVALLRELEAYSEEHPTMRNVPHDAGHLLHILAGAMGARHVLEIGTSNGYSGIWLATALQRTGGTLVSIERDSAKVNLARPNFRRAGVTDVVDIRMGDAARVLPELDGRFDLVWLDAAKRGQLGYLQHLLHEGRIEPGGLIVSDNALTHPEALADYHSFVRTYPRLESLMVPIGNGFEVSFLPG